MLSFREYLILLSSAPLRVRILKLSTGIMDSVSLSHLLPGVGVVTGGVTVSVKAREDDLHEGCRSTDKEC